MNSWTLHLVRACVGCSNAIEGLLDRASESQVSAAGGGDNPIHKNEHSVVTPAVGPRFAPEAGVPSKYFLLYDAEHNQNQADGGELCENARNYSEAAATIRTAIKDPDCPLPITIASKFFFMSADHPR